jgi:hypothetical protein
MPKHRRKFNVFSLAFMDCICCGFGAVILLFVILNARGDMRDTEAVPVPPPIDDRRSEVKKIELEILKGQRDLVQIRNTIKVVEEENVKTEGRAEKVIEQITKIQEELQKKDGSTLATKAHVNKLKADLKALEEEMKRREAGIKAQTDEQAGEKVREFEGVGDRHYLTGLKVGGDRILILFDCSASMLGDRIVDILRRRNLSDEEKVKAAKWRRAVKTVDWLMTQLPEDSEFQIYGFNETAFTLVKGEGKTWLDASKRENLDAAAEAAAKQIPEGGTSLAQAFRIARSMSPPPDNVILLTDGLPTMGDKKGGFTGLRKTISGEDRLKLFYQELGAMPTDVPYNVILYPMEGDPYAAFAFWQLAVRTNGSYYCPSRDWP